MILIAAIVVELARAGGYRPVPKHWSARHSTSVGWFRAALCIHQHEGAWNANTGNGYWGGLQFLPSTWYSVGGTTPAYLVTPREQLYRARLVWRRDGGSWREWGTARACGVR